MRVLSATPFVLLAALLTVGCACRPKPKPKPVAKAAEEEKAWVDAKDVCVFRYGERKLPINATDFDHALTKGWERSFLLPDLERTVEVDGGERYPRLRALR